jgi:hypothetical protein
VSVPNGAEMKQFFRSALFAFDATFAIVGDYWTICFDSILFFAFQRVGWLIICNEPDTCGIPSGQNAMMMFFSTF